MLLHYKIHGDTSPAARTVILLHGMAASGRYWRRLVELQTPGIRYVSIDLLGFGQSPKPKHITYDYVTHLAAIHETLAAIGISKPVSLVGHSMGALLALRYAAEHPTAIDKLLLVGMPYFSSANQARLDITGSNFFRKLVYYGPTSHFLCTVWCRLLRPVTRHIAPFYLRHIPHYVAQDTLLHTWQSYAQSLQYVIENQAVTKDLLAITSTAVIVYGQDEPSRGYLAEAYSTNPHEGPISFISFPETGHQLPVTNPEIMKKLLLD